MCQLIYFVLQALFRISVWACFQFPTVPGTEAESEAWVNALLGRIFWDFLREKYWADMVSKKIQMKLSKIRVCLFFKSYSWFFKFKWFDGILKLVF